eukprot:1380021-Pyramimonas_sp.AAC.1
MTKGASRMPLPGSPKALGRRHISEPVIVRAQGLRNLQGLNANTLGLHRGLEVQDHARARVRLEWGQEVGRHFE